jgi:pimeloyl-ACP methyl ester carboxylesterase
MPADPFFQRGYAPINGLSMYFEIRGQGRPLILLNGGFGLVEQWGELAAQLAATRQVIALEFQGHGRTADVDRPFSFEQFADDVAGLMDYLGFASADVLGYSLGGLVAIQTALRHPQRVRKLIVVSAPYHEYGWYDSEREGIRQVTGEALLGSPMHAAYAQVAPDPERFGILAEKTRDLLLSGFNWTIDLTTLAIPVLIVAGDADNMPLAHPLTFFALFGGGISNTGAGERSPAQLAIVPGTHHYVILTRVAILVPAITSFLGPDDTARASVRVAT